MKTWSLPVLALLAIALITRPMAFHGLRQPQGFKVQATTNATLAVMPDSQEASPSAQVTVNVVMNPDSNQVSGLGFRFWYDSQLANPQAVVGSVFDSQTDFGGPYLGGNYVEVALARSSGTVPYAGGTVTVASVTFDSSSTACGTARLTFDPAHTQVLNTSTVNVLSTAFPGTIDFPSCEIYVPIILKSSQ